jgi:hypothetical protein
MRLVEQQVEEDSGYNNKFHSPELIEYLLSKRMPYCALWSGLVWKGREPVTRGNNGRIERHIRFKKDSVNLNQILPPAKYVFKSCQVVSSQCIEYDKFISNPKAKKKRTRTHSSCYLV